MATPLSLPTSKTTDPLLLIGLLSALALIALLRPGPRPASIAAEVALACVAPLALGSAGWAGCA